MTRYRPSSTVPGEKRPWLIESDEDSRPPDPDPDRLRGGSGDVRVIAFTAAFESTTGRSGESSAGGDVGACDVPQCGQNRALSGIFAPQPPHSIGRFYGIRPGRKKAPHG